MKKYFMLLSTLMLLFASLVPAAAQDGPYPLYLIDDMGREVTIDARPERIVSLSPAITEMIWALEAGDRQVARSEFCSYPPEVSELPAAGGFTADTVSIEALLELEPDIVFADSIHAPLAESLDELGITLYLMQPQGIKGVYANIVTVGYILDVPYKAFEVVTGINQQINAVERAVASLPPEERATVFYEVWDEPLMTTTPITFIGEVIEVAGGLNIFADLNEPWPTISAEAIVERNPDVILSPESHGSAMAINTLLERSGWDSVSAVANGEIYLMEDDPISRPGPRVGYAVRMVARALYPDLFK